MIMSATYRSADVARVPEIDIEPAMLGVDGLSSLRPHAWDIEDHLRGSCDPAVLAHAHDAVALVNLSRESEIAEAVRSSRTVRRTSQRPGSREHTSCTPCHLVASVRKSYGRGMSEQLTPGMCPRCGIPLAHRGIGRPAVWCSRALNIYTDGSSRQAPRRGGYGCVFVDVDETETKSRSIVRAKVTSGPRTTRWNCWRVLKH
jgi:hypothetical protein